MPKTRVLVIEDSLTVRKHLVAVLSAASGIEVVGEAEDGKRGTELCMSLRPDVVTLDLMLPVMDGLAATEYIMAYCPTPILIVSASTNRGELFKTYEALAAGALEVLDKPLGGEPDGDWEARLVATVKLVSRVRVITHLRARLGSLARGSGRPQSLPPRSATGGPVRLVAVGVSTGGPAALVTILRGLPSDFPLPLLIVIHMGKLFAPAFAEWLNGQSPIPVRNARDGEPLPLPGNPSVLVAPADQHLVVRHGFLRLTDDPELHSCRPAVDRLFLSLAQEMGARAVGCLLTGMGKDGAEGLLAMRRAGGKTIAQDEASSVVFGMPREAILLGAAEVVLPLDQMAGAFIELAAREREVKRWA
jgi:two-component system, chemotaxis family, protein-glutamate methylesterase/glutaminase